MKKRTNRRMLAFYILMAVVLTVGTFATVIGPDSNDSDEIANTSIPSTPQPTPFTFPTPEPDGPSLTLRPPLVNSSGLFQLSVPEGWEITSNGYDFNLSGARSAFLNSSRLSVIDAQLLVGINYPSHQALSDDYFTTDYFFRSWGSYDGFTETKRTVGDRIVIDFKLGLGQQAYLARQVAWMDGDWVRLIRFVVPENNPALLDKLDELIVPTIISYNDQRDTSPTWVSYADTERRFLIRHPNWTLISGGGAPILEAPLSPASMILRSQEDQLLSSLDEAEAYVQETLRPGAEILSSQVTHREYGSGYMVSFADRDNEGNPVSVLAVMLNDDANNLYVAEIRLTRGEIDLLQPSEVPEYQELRTIADTFMILPPEGTIAVPSENPPVIEATEETQPTEEATEESTN